MPIGGVLSIRTTIFSLVALGVGFSVIVFVVRLIARARRHTHMHTQRSHTAFALAHHNVIAQLHRLRIAVVSVVCIQHGHEYQQIWNY